MQLEKEISVEIETFEGSFSIDIDWDASETILRPHEYIDQWQIVFWDKALKFDIAFAKGDNLSEFEEGALAIKRVAYR